MVMGSSGLTIDPSAAIEGLPPKGVPYRPSPVCCLCRRGSSARSALGVVLPSFTFEV